MKFKIDENLPVELAEVLRSNHHDAATVSEQEMSGAADSDVAEVCRQEKRILVTLDLDFADIRAYPPQQYAGIIVLRVQRQDKRHITTVFKKVG